jgi:phage shock protein A
MGIFTRFRDIVSANLNAILDRAEDPEKMVRLMIQEMEDTLVEVKSSCAGLIADQKKLERTRAGVQQEADHWAAKAELAVSKARDDLARAALAEKRRYQDRFTHLEEELTHTRDAVSSLQAEIGQLEIKLAEARDKQRTIIQRRTAAMVCRESQQRIRRIDTSEAFVKFEAYERGIDRLEAEAQLVDGLRPKVKDRLHEEFATLEHEDDIERELKELKEKAKPAGSGSNKPA